MILSRCPNCDTVFRVTPEQLAARQGMVRCGRCGTAFSALGALVTPPPAAAAVVPEAITKSKTSSADGAAQTVAVGEAPAAMETGAAIAAPKPLSAFLQPQETPAESPLPSAAASDATAAVESAAAREPDAMAGANAAGPAHEDAASSRASEDDADLQPSVHASPLALATDFLRRRPTIAWTGAVVALAALAIAQSLYVFRGDIAQAWPGTRPLLDAFCAPFGCRVELPRQADLIGIELSDLQPDREHGDRLVLAATLRNRAPFAQSLPHLELTLTDARDRALARRVIAPEEYLGTGADLAAGIAANAEQTVQLMFSANGVAASGYRLYLFYP